MDGIRNNNAVVSDLSRMTPQRSNPYDVSMQDFFTLMVAQLTNQSMFDPVDDAQFMAQMAQFSSMQAMQQLTSAFMSSMSAGFIGKYVIVQAINEQGQLVRDEGYVDAVNFELGRSMLLINGKWFTMDSVTQMHASKPPAPPQNIPPQPPPPATPPETEQDDEKDE